LTTNEIRNISDQELIELYIKDQSNKYFDILYERYSPRVYGKSLSLIKNEAIAQDLSQETFVKIFTNLSKFKGNSKFSTWVYSITYNTCMDYIRKQKRRDFVDEIDEEKIEGEVEDISDSQILEVKIERLAIILDLLDIEDKAILLMKYQDGMSINDISGITNKSESAVKMKLKRAKVKFVKIHTEHFKNEY